MEANCSYIITDPKGELSQSMGGFFEEEGYDVKIINLVDMRNSDCYNPMAYVHDPIQGAKLVSVLMSNTTPQQAQSNDPFWEQAEKGLLTAFILYLHEYAPSHEQNLSMVAYMIEHSSSKEEDGGGKSPVELLFDELSAAAPSDPAVKMYHNFQMAASKTASSILISAAVRLQSFILPEVERLTRRDDLDLRTLGEKKRVIFAITADNDKTFDYLMGMLYSQTFQELYDCADSDHDGRLPIPVRLMMDEFANIAMPSEFETILATCRSRQISVNIVLQSLAQLKGKFKDGKWEGIVGNCDSFVYLGGNEQSTHEYISKSLGKETIDIRTRGISRGRSGSSSTNYQSTGRELMTPDEVRVLSNRKTILLLKGLYPVLDLKHDLKKHPNYPRTADGGKPLYKRGNKPMQFAKKDLGYVPTIENIEILEETHNESETHLDLKKP